VDSDGTNDLSIYTFDEEDFSGAMFFTRLGSTPPRLSGARLRGVSSGSSHFDVGGLQDTNGDHVDDAYIFQDGYLYLFRGPLLEGYYTAEMADRVFYLESFSAHPYWPYVTGIGDVTGDGRADWVSFPVLYFGHE